MNRDLKIIFVWVLLILAIPTVLSAQDFDYLKKAREWLDKGDCTRAEQNYDMYKTMNNKTDKEIERRIEECKPCKGFLKISGDNSLLMSSSIYIDGVLITNPSINENQTMDCGTYTIRAEHKDYEKFEKRVTVEKGKSVDAEVIMIPKSCNGYLKIEGEQRALSQATIYRDGKVWPNPPINKSQAMECGKYTIRVEHQDYEPFEKKVTVEKDKTSIITVNMPPVSKTGFLKLEGNMALLSKATITIDDKQVHDAHQNVQELSIGKHTVWVAHDGYIPFEQNVMINSGETTYLRVKLEQESVTVSLVVWENADIYIKDSLLFGSKWNGYSTTWKGDLKLGEYTIVCRKDGWKDSKWNYSVYKTTNSITLKPPTPYTNFITLDGAINNNFGKPSFGFSYGRLLTDRGGVFISFMTNFVTVGTDKMCDKEGYLYDGTFPHYIGQKTSRWSVVFGGILRVGNLFYIKAGVGPGARNVFWESEDGTYYHNLGYSPKNKVGVDVSAGLQYHIKGHYVIAFDAVTNGFRTTDLKIGMGYSF